MAERRGGVAAAAARAAGERVRDHLEALVASGDPAPPLRLGLYAARPGEVDLAPVAAWATARALPVLWPRQRGDGGLDFAPGAEADLVKGPHGVREPPPDAPAVVPDETTWLLVPGVAFDPGGGRLGRGGGAYDRALSGCPAAVRVGVGFEFQVVDAVPTGRHDQVMHVIVTEARVRRCG